MNFLWIESQRLKNHMLNFYADVTHSKLVDKKDVRVRNRNGNHLFGDLAIYEFNQIQHLMIGTFSYQNIRTLSISDNEQLLEIIVEKEAFYRTAKLVLSSRFPVGFIHSPDLPLLNTVWFKESSFRNVQTVIFESEWSTSRMIALDLPQLGCIELQHNVFSKASNCTLSSRMELGMIDVYISPSYPIYRLDITRSSILRRWFWKVGHLLSITHSQQIPLSEMAPFRFVIIKGQIITSLVKHSTNWKISRLRAIQVGFGRCIDNAVESTKLKQKIINFHPELKFD